MPAGVPGATFTAPLSGFKVTPALVVETCVNVMLARVAGLPFNVSLVNTFANDCPPAVPSTVAPVSLTALIAITVSVSVVVAGVGSVVPTGGVDVKVFATVPLGAVTFAVTVKLILPPFGRVGTMTVPASRLVMFICPAPAPTVGQTAPPAGVQAPIAALVSPATAGSLSVELFAALGPLFVRVNV